MRGQSCRLRLRSRPQPSPCRLNRRRARGRRFDPRERHPVHPRRARISASDPISMVQNVVAADLVVEYVETESRLRLRFTIQLSLKSPDLVRRLQAHRQSPSPHHRQKHTRSQGPSLHRHYPASAVLWPCPTPAPNRRAKHAVEAATLARNGSPPITRITLPACRAHYPSGSSGCARRLLPYSCCLPLISGGSASASSLSRPAQASHSLRPAGSLNRPRRAAFVTRLPPGRLPCQAARQLPDLSTTIWVEPPSTGVARRRGAPRNAG